MLPVLRYWAGVLLTTVMVFGAAPAVFAGGVEYRTDDSIEAPLVAAGTLLLGGILLAERAQPVLTLADLESLDPSGLPAWDRPAIDHWSPRAAAWSDGILRASQVAPLFLMATDRGRDQAGRLTVMYAETLLLNTGLTGLLKALTSRHRPYAYGRNPEVPDDLLLAETTRRSFPSGHTSTVFACLTFCTVVHRDLYPNSGSNDLILAGSVGIGVLTGYLRYAAGRHFPSDVAAGAVLGVAVGWLVPRLHRQEGTTGEGGSVALPLFTATRRF